MKSTYAVWIAFHTDTGPLPGRGRCQELSEAMAAQFPELRVVAGYYHCPIWKSQQHWWCITPDGKIVDPTAAQFPSGGLGKYEELAPEDRPIGTCMDCGADVFPNPYAPEFCSDTCRLSTIRYLETGEL